MKTKLTLITLVVWAICTIGYSQPATTNQSSVLVMEKNMTFYNRIYLVQLLKNGNYYELAVRESGLAADQLANNPALKTKMSAAVDSVNKIIQQLQEDTTSINKKLNDSINTLNEDRKESLRKSVVQKTDRLKGLQKDVEDLQDNLRSAESYRVPIVGLQQSVIGNNLFDILEKIHPAEFEPKDRPTIEKEAQNYLLDVLALLSDSQPVTGTLCISKRVPIEKTPERFNNNIKLNTEYLLKKTLKKMKLPVAREKAKKPDSTKVIIENTIGGQLHLKGYEGHKSYYRLLYSEGLSLEKRKSILDELAKGNLGFRKYRGAVFTWLFKSKNRLYQRVNALNVINNRDTLNVDSVQIEFYEGSILNIIVSGRADSNNSLYLDFYNRNIPYQFSSMTHYHDVDRYYPLQSRSIRDGRLRVSQDNHYNLNLYDLIRYIPRFQTNCMNYSPKDTAMTFNLSQTQGSETCWELKKEKTSNLIDLKVYTDPIGLSGDEPNGLLQFEVSKKVILRPRSTKINGLTFIEPSLTISRIEKDTDLLERSLVSVNGTGNNAVASEINMIDLFHHNKLQLGATLNLITCGNAAFGIIHQFNIGGSIFQTKVQDKISTVTKMTDTVITVPSLNDTIITITQRDSVFSSSSVSIVNNANFYFEYRANVQPDERYGFSFYGRIGQMLTLTKSTVVQNQPTTFSPNYFQIGLEANLFLNNIDKFFFRGFYTSTLQTKLKTGTDSATETQPVNFLAVHVGYSRSLSREVHRLSKKP